MSSTPEQNPAVGSVLARRRVTLSPSWIRGSVRRTLRHLRRIKRDSRLHPCLPSALADFHRNWARRPLPAYR